MTRRKVYRFAADAAILAGAGSLLLGGAAAGLKINRVFNAIIMSQNALDRIVSCMQRGVVK